MRHLRALVSAGAIAVAAIPGPAGTLAEEGAKIRIATEGAYPPWNHIDTAGRLVGFELDLAADLCSRMAVECELVTEAWDGIIPALRDGEYDAIMAGIPITDDRRKVIQFSEAYAATPARVAVLEGSELAGYRSELDRLDLDEIDDAEQTAIDRLAVLLDGRTLGVLVASPQARFLERHLGNVEIRKYDTQEHLDLDLQHGRVDAALASMSDWQPLLATAAGVDVTLIGPGLTGGPFGDGVGVGIRKEDDALVEKFNTAIAAAKEDGTIARLAERWFGFDASV